MTTTEQTTQAAQSIGLIASVAASPFDGGALAGAFAGSALYAINSKEHGTKKKLLNMGLSIFIGYFFREFIGEKFNIEDMMLSAFLASALGVFFFGVVLEQAEKIDLFARFKK